MLTLDGDTIKNYYINSKIIKTILVIGLPIYPSSCLPIKKYIYLKENRMT